MRRYLSERADDAPWSPLRLSSTLNRTIRTRRRPVQSFTHDHMSSCAIVPQIVDSAAVDMSQEATSMSIMVTRLSNLALGVIDTGAGGNTSHRFADCELEHDGERWRGVEFWEPFAMGQCPSIIGPSVDAMSEPSCDCPISVVKV
ncbi:hypothetical protein BDZ91DRAFT_723203 [Kalaharituber pfeilii]|nr:hypothetical protein BDZ91DRAFT_723203 [Kalaharituber pfeilii]